MKRSRSLKESPFTALQQVLTQVDSWLLRDGASRIIVAAASHKEMNKCGLPPHVSITAKKRIGKRRTFRGRRNYQESRTKLAVWPDDAMDENPLPSIACIVSGVADLHIADYVLQCQAGDWILLPAGVPKQDGSKPHFEGETAGRHCDILWIYPGPTKDTGLSCWVCRSENETHRQQSEIGIGWFPHNFLARLFGGFCDEIQSEAPRKEIASHLLRGTLMMLIAEIEAGQVTNDPGLFIPTTKTPRSNPVEEALAYMEENLTRHLTIQHVAAQVLLSPTTFIRVFRERTGETFHHRLTYLRMHRAEELLKAGTLPIHLICPRVGLKYGQLRALFQQFHQCSPGEFRERNAPKA